MARFFEAQSSLEGPKSAEALAQSGVQAVDDVTVNLDQREEPEEDADADWQPSSGGSSWSSGGINGEQDSDSHSSDVESCNEEEDNAPLLMQSPMHRPRTFH